MGSFAPLLIGIVSFRSGRILLRCLESIYANPPDIDFTICVVNNDPSSGDSQAVQFHFPEVIVIDNERNVGFGAGMNRVFRSCPSNYFLILNPDTQVQQGALNALVGFLDSHPSAGIVGPQLRYPDGGLQPSTRRFPTLTLTLLRVLDLHLRFPNNRSLKSTAYDLRGHLSVRAVDWITGAALLVRSELFQRVAGFDERFFLYSEEVDLCRRIRKEGFEVVFVPDAKVVHLHAHATRRTDVRQVDFYQSLYLYFQKHHGWLPARIIRLCLLLRQMVYIPAICVLQLSQPDSTQCRLRLLPAIRLLSWAIGLSSHRSAC